jgi:hypothetical protein
MKDKKWTYTSLPFLVLKLCAWQEQALTTSMHDQSI